MKKLLTCSLILLNGLLGCGRNSRCGTPQSTDRSMYTRTAIVLSWQGYDGEGETENAIYFINSIAIGKGQSAFRHILSLIDKLPQGSIVILDYSDTKNLQHSQSGPGYYMPYSSDAEVLNEIIMRKHLSVITPAGQLFGGNGLKH